MAGTVFSGHDSHYKCNTISSSTLLSLPCSKSPYSMHVPAFVLRQTRVACMWYTCTKHLSHMGAMSKGAQNLGELAPVARCDDPDSGLYQESKYNMISDPQAGLHPPSTSQPALAAPILPKSSSLTVTRTRR